MSRFDQNSNIYHLLKNPDKYVGKEKIITTRSSWERDFALWCDRNRNILEWSSEDIVVPYRYSLDNKIHRYFTDFYIKVKEKDGIKEYIIEIKPYDQTKPPKRPKRKTKSYNKRICEYVKNTDKWRATKLYCRKLREEQNRNIEFKIITERELYNNK